MYENQKAVAKILSALAHSTRIQIVTHISTHGPICVTDLLPVLGKGQEVVSHHVGVLRKAGIIRSSRLGKRLMYSLTGRVYVDIIGDLTKT